MSEFKVPLTTVGEILVHINAERLEIAEIYGFSVVVGKNSYVKGERCVYVPIDSVIPQVLEAKLFPEGSKVKLHRSRVKQINIRNFPSQGMIISTSDIEETYNISLRDTPLETDLSELLNIKKYEPPTPSYQTAGSNPPKVKPLQNPYFREYNGITNIKWNPDPFKDEEVIIQCKLHGSHIRFGKAPFVANTLWKKFLKFIRLTPKFEFVYGSNRVELTNRSGYKGYYGENIYANALERVDAYKKVKDGEFVHAELIGPGIQKGYTYGHKEHHVVIYDVRVMQEDGSQKWLNPEECEAYAAERGFTFVPVLYRGVYSKEVLENCTKGPSVYCPAEKLREGCVVKSRYNYHNNGSKKALKSINPDYLNTNPTDNH